MQAKVYWIAFISLLRKEIKRFLRIWVQTLLPPLVTMTLYFLIFGNLVGQRLGNIQGYSYMQYIAPGLIMMSVITAAYTNVVTSFFGMRFQRSIEELIVAPLPNYLLLSGFVAGGVARGLLVGVLVTILALFFTQLHVFNIFVLLAIVPMTTILFSLAGFTNALFAKTFDDVSIVPTFVLTPLTYLGGIFYSIDLLPSFWRHLSLFNPILYIVNSFRYGLLGISDIPVISALTIIFFSCVILFFINLYLLNRGKGIRT
ncbi:MAG: ABC transporter permease [Candidatus Aquirickettsiella sp.]